tara:strand:- start:711 stop:905 length:195 start_codon:yes stop_codon:yes gene_type:complete
MIDTDKYEGCITDMKGYDLAILAEELLTEVKRLRKQLGRYTQFVLWVEEEHNEVFDEYEGKDEL